MIPLRGDGSVLTVAMVDPTRQEPLENIRRLTGRQIDVVVASKSYIQKITVEFHGFRPSVKPAALNLTPVVDLGNLERHNPPPGPRGAELLGSVNRPADHRPAPGEAGLSQLHL